MDVESAMVQCKNAELELGLSPTALRLASVVLHLRSATMLGERQRQDGGDFQPKSNPNYPVPNACRVDSGFLGPIIADELHQSK